MVARIGSAAVHCYDLANDEADPVTVTAGGVPQIFIHVGEPKTGTTFLQQLMFQNRDVLAEQGVLLPGPRPMFHWRAAQDLREVVQIPNDPVGPFAGAWDRLVRQALKAPRVGIASHELLASATAAQAERAVRSFGSAEVHVVITLRDFGSLLPAEWQETIKHRNTRGWEDWLGDVIDRESTAPDRDQYWFWKVHDTMAILRRWGSLLPPERVHVITMPPRGSSQALLWTRFAALIGVDPDSVDTSTVRANASLGLAEVELLRRVNQSLPDSIPNWFYMWHVKEALAHGVLNARPKVGGRLALPQTRDEWVQAHAASLVADLRAAGYDIVGDLDELMPRLEPGPRPSPRDATPDDMVGAGVDAVVTLLGELATAKNVGGASPKPAADAAATPAQQAARGTLAAPGRVKRVLIHYSQQHMWAHNLRQRYWRLANARRNRSAAARTGG